MKIETISINKINPAKYNPRKDLQPGDPEYEKLKKSILTFEMVEPLIWNKRTGNLVGGHQRLKILKELGHNDVEVSIVDLSDSREKALNLALNKIQGEWDLPKLKDLLQELDTGEFDLEITGFDAEEVEDLMTQYHVIVKGKTDPDQIPEKVKTICRPGDLWQLGPHRLLCGDAIIGEDLKKLLAGRKIDMVFTDPPYGVDYNSTATGRSHKQWAKLANDKRATVGFFSSWLVLLQQESLSDASYYICIGDTTAPILVQSFEELKIHWTVPVIWVKNHAPPSWNRYHHKHETIYYCGPGSVPTGELSRWYGPKNEVTTWEINKDAHREYKHPTQKPVALAARAIHNSSALDQIVVDLFGGSGSTMIACEQLGRRCYMMEIDAHYCDIIIERWQNFTGKKAERINDGARSKTKTDRDKKTRGKSRQTAPARTGQGK